MPYREMTSTTFDEYTFINTIVKEYYENAEKSLYSIVEENYQRVIGFNSSNEKTIQDYYTSISTFQCDEIKNESVFSILFNKIQQIIDDNYDSDDDTDTE
jgi:hypothetical protein